MNEVKTRYFVLHFINYNQVYKQHAKSLYFSKCGADQHCSPTIQSHKQVRRCYSMLIILKSLFFFKDEMCSSCINRADLIDMAYDIHYCI